MPTSTRASLGGCHNRRVETMIFVVACVLGAGALAYAQLYRRGHVRGSGRVGGSSSDGGSSAGGGWFGDWGSDAGGGDGGGGDGGGGGGD